MKPQSTHIPDSWRRSANAVRRRVNFGWFWHYFSPWMAASLALCGFLLWLLRLQETALIPAWVALGGCLIVSAIAARSKADFKKIGMETALSRLDVGWHMDHRLVSAWRGIGDWPVFPEEEIPLRIKPGVAAGPLLLGSLFIFSSLYIPLPPEKNIQDFTRMEPPDWQTLETLADELEDRNLVEENATRALKRELEQLREKPMEEWYDPSTMEATDRLRSRMRNDSERLMQAMNNTSALLQLAESGREQLSDSRQQAMQEFLNQMREQMQQGGMQPNPQLMQQIQELDLSQLQQMDAAQLQRLEQELMQNREGMEQALIAAGLISSDGDGEPGRGGISRGGGPVDLTLRDFETAVEPVIPMALDPGKMENARIGDLLEIRETEHRDEREETSTTGGAVDSAGGSGEVVWEQDVLPEEQKILKEFFK